MRNHLQPRLRDGFALPMALFAMIVIGVIVTGGFYMSSQEHRVSISTDMGAQALNVAEYGLDEAVGTWSSGALGGAPGAVQTFDPVTVMNGPAALGEYGITVMPLGGRIYMLESEGRVTRGPQEAVRRVGGFVRTTNGQLPYNAAVSVYGQLSAGGNAEITGFDADDCLGSNVPAVVAVDTSLVSDGQGNKDRITGEPDVEADPNMTTSELSDFGDIDLSDLIAMATKVYEAGESQNNMQPVAMTGSDGNQVCNTAVRHNWGEPNRPDPMPDPAPVCMNHFPIIYAKGDLTLQTGRGQGILVVNGDLRMTGNMQFYGIVIVLGSFFTAGTGNHVGGSLIIHGDGNLDSESVSTGNSLVEFSSCRIQDAFNDLPIRPFASRSWIVDPPPLSNAGV